MLKLLHSFGNFKKNVFLVSFYSKFSGFFSERWGKHFSKRSLIKHNCSWRDKLIVLWTLNRQAKIFLRTAYWIMKISWKHHTGGWSKNISKKGCKVKMVRIFFEKSPSHVLPCKLRRQFLSWTSTKTRILNYIVFFFCSTNNSGDSHRSTSPTINMSFQLGQTWSCLNMC